MILKVELGQLTSDVSPLANKGLDDSHGCHYLLIDPGNLAVLVIRD